MEERPAIATSAPAARQGEFGFLEFLIVAFMSMLFGLLSRI